MLRSIAYTVPLWAALFLVTTSGCPAVVVNENDASVDAGPSSCGNDSECDNGQSCTVGSCNAATNLCEQTVVAGSCFVDGQCYNTGQAQPGDGCKVCDPALQSESLVNMVCTGGGTCDPLTGACSVDPDASDGDVSDGDVSDGDTTPNDVEADVSVDVPPSDVPDVSPDIPDGPDVADVPDVPDAPDVPDVPDVPSTPPSASLSVTSGGGQGSSEGHKIRILIGPQKVGRGTSTDHSIRIGVGEIQHAP